MVKEKWEGPKWSGVLEIEEQLMNNLFVTRPKQEVTPMAILPLLLPHLTADPKAPLDATNSAATPTPAATTPMSITSTAIGSPLVLQP